MTLGEIKAEALMLMFADLDLSTEDCEDISDALLSLRADDNYKYYLNALSGAINRCFASLEQKCILPAMQKDLTENDGDVLGKKIRFDLNKLIPDIFAVEKIHIYTPENSIYLCEFDTEGRGTIVVNHIKNATYTIIYTPKISRVTMLTPSSAEICLPDDIACLIPYFVKGDLFRYESSEEASEARNIYEAMCEEMLEHKNCTTYFTNTIYSLGRI